MQLPFANVDSAMVDGDVLRRLQDFVDYPHEDLNVEIKGWLDFSDEVDRAKLAKAVIAIANHCGGYILLGFREASGAWEPDPDRPANLDSYNQDLVNGTIQRYAEPGFHCELHLVERSDTQLSHPVIIVPGGGGIEFRFAPSGADLMVKASRSTNTTSGGRDRRASRRNLARSGIISYGSVWVLDVKRSWTNSEK